MFDAASKRKQGLMSIDELHEQQEGISAQSSSTSPSSSSSTLSNSLPDASNLMNGLIRLMGLDPSKIGALALNGIVFIAQMVRMGYHWVVQSTANAFWNWYTILKYISQRMYTLENYQNQNCTATDGSCNYQPPTPIIPQFL